MSTKQLQQYAIQLIEAGYNLKVVISWYVRQLGRYTAEMNTAAGGVFTAQQAKEFIIRYV